MALFGKLGDASSCSQYDGDDQSLLLMACLSTNNVSFGDFCKSWPDNWNCTQDAATCHVSLNYFFQGYTGETDSGVPCLLNDSYKICSAKADQDTYDLDQLVTQLAQGWNPTGFYTNDVILQITTKWTERSTAARAAIANAQSNAKDSDNIGILKDRLDSLDTFDKQGASYLSAAQSAGPDGIVQADKLKDWILGGLRAASDAQHAAEVVTCQHDQDWSPLVALGAFLWSVGGVAKDVVTAAYNTGKKVVQASEWLMGSLGWIVTHPWTVFGGLALVAVTALGVKNKDKIKTAFARLKHRREA